MGRDLTPEPATFNTRDSSFIPNDLLPVPFKRVKVTESEDKASIEEDNDGNLSVQVESETVRSYTDRLFVKRPPRGGFRGRGLRGRGARAPGDGRGGRQPTARAPGGRDQGDAERRGQFLAAPIEIDTLPKTICHILSFFAMPI